MIKRLPFLLASLLLLAPLAARAIDVAESAQFDFSNTSFGTPYVLTLGNNTFSGSINTSFEVQDRFSVTVPAGMQITQIRRTFNENPNYPRLPMQNAFIQFNLEYTMGSGSKTFGASGLTGNNTCLVNANFAVGNPWTVTIVVGTLPAVVTSVVAPPDRIYLPGDALTFTVNFSKTVTVSGTPRLPLVIGTTSRNATYVSGSGSTALTFRYVVQAGERDTDGITLQSPLAGGTITGSDNAAAQLGFTAPNTRNVLVDTIGLMNVTGPPNGSYGAGQVLNFTANFVSPATVTGVPRLAVTIGTTTRFATYVSGSGTTALQFSYTVQSLENDADGISVASPLQLNGGTITDGSFNPGLRAFVPPDLRNVLVDAAGPTITISSPSVASTVSGPVTYTVTYADPVFSASTLVAGQIILNRTGTADGTVAVTGSGPTRTVTLSGITGDGTLSISLPAGTASDTIGNLAGAAGPSAAVSVGAPSITRVTLFGVPGFVKAGDTYTFIVSLSAPVNVTGTPQLSLVIGGVTRQASYGVGGTSTDLAFTYVVQPGDNDDDGITVSSPLLLNGGTIKDKLTGANAALTFTPPNTAGRLVDTTLPTVTISGPSAAVTSSGPITFTVTFADANFNSGLLHQGQVTLNRTGTASGVVAVSGAGPTRTVTINSITGAGLLGISLFSGSATDLAGNLAAAVGPSATCLVQPTPGTASAWGLNSSGQLGNNSLAGSLVPVAVDTNGAFGAQPVVAVAPGAGFSLALNFYGQVFAWGKNDKGQLGNNTVVDSQGPVAVDTSGVLNGQVITAAAAGRQHSLAVGNDGRVFAWGLNASGQLGNGTTTDSRVPVVLTSPAISNKFIVAIAAGASHSLALTSDGLVFVWGANAKGQLGNNSTTDLSTPVALAPSAFGGKAVKFIAAGMTHSLAVASDGQVFTWGDNSSGQLGNNSLTDSRVPVALATSLFSGKAMASLSASSNHSLALAADGALFSWGANRKGQLGNSSTTASKQPVQVGGTTQFKAIAAGTEFSLGLTSSGVVYGWGDNAAGQIGNNSTTSLNVPGAGPSFSGRQVLRLGVGGGGGPSHALAVVKPAPVVLSVAAVDGTYRATKRINITAEFSLPVTVTGSPQVALMVGGTPRLANYLSTSGSTVTFSYTVAPGEVDLDGITLSSPILGGVSSISDAPGGGAPNIPAASLAFVPPNTTGVKVDAVLPTVTIGTPTVSFTRNGPVSFPVTYVDNDSIAAITLAPAKVSVYRTGTAAATAAVSGTGDTRTVTLNSITGEGTLYFNVLAGTATDPAGNTALASGLSASVTVDATRPTVTISAPSATSTTNQSVSYTVTYADANFGASTLAPADVVLNKTGTANGAVSVTGTGLTRTVTIDSFTGSGTLGISLLAGTAADLAGNMALAAGPSATFTLVSANSAPTVAGPIPNYSVLEDAVNTTANLTTVFADAETPAASLTYAVVANTNTGLVTATISNGTNLVLAYAPNGNGTSEISVSATDAGGLSVTNTFVVTVVAVNDAPHLTVATNVVVTTGNAVARTVAAFAGFSAGPPDEAAQTVTYTLTVDNPALFIVQPALAADGTLSFRPARGQGGATLVTVVAQDDGGTASGGVDRATNSFVVAVQVAPGSLDTSFPATANGAVYTTAMQPDGRVLVGGVFSSINGEARQNLARLNPDGTVDLGFAPTTDGSVTTLTVQTNGGILVGGTFNNVNGVPRQKIARLNADGTLAAGFDHAVNSTIFAMLEQSDGKILVAGDFTSFGGFSLPYLVRLLPDGQVEMAYAPGVNGVIYTIALQPDGRLLVGGGFSQVNGVPQARLARLDAAGTLDGGFNPGAGNNVFCLTLTASGQIVVGGAFNTLAGQPRQRLGRLNTDGTADLTFNPGVSGNVYSLALQADGSLILGGAFLTVGGQAHNRVARINELGQVDSNFDPSLSHDAFSVALQGDGRVLVGGPFTTLGGSPQSRFARLVNGLATQALTASVGQVSWQRGGTAPEARSTTFELSTDGGASWIFLGAGTRVGGGWELTGLTLPAGGLIRARAQVPGGQQVGSMALVETIAPFPNTAPTAAGALAAVSLNAGTPTATVALPTAFADAETPAAELVYTVTGNTNLAVVVATIAGGTNLSLVPVPGLEGTSLVTVRATDVGGLFLEQTVLVTVTVNQAPTLDFAQRVLGVPGTDTSVQTVSGFATLAPGPAAEAGQTLGLTATTDNPALFSAGPTVLADGTLTYTLAMGASGSALVTVVAMDNGGTALGGHDRTTNMFRINVVPADLVVSSTADSGPGSLRQVIANANASGGPVTILFAPGSGVTPVTPLPAFTGPVTLAGSGALPPLEVGSGGVLDLGGGTFSGTTISVQNGGTLSGSGTFAGNLTVAPGGTVAPGSSPGQLAADSGNWDGGGSYVWEINNAAGAAGTASDLLVFTGQLAITATPANPFTVKMRTLTSANVAGPMANFTGTSDLAWTIAQAGSLTGFDLAALQLDTTEVANALGTGVFRLRRSGNSVQVTFSLNSAPTVTAAPGPVTVLEDASNTVLPMAGSFSDAQQASAQLNYQVTGNTAPGLVTATFGAGGMLTLAYAPDQHGSATLTVRATDSEGLFAETAFAVTVTSVNDAPAITFGEATLTVGEDAGAQLLPGFASLSVGPANEASQSLTVVSVTADNLALFSFAPALDASGRLSFTSATNASGQATVTVVVQDNGGGTDRRTNSFLLVVTPVNDRPVAGADAQALNQDDVLTVAAPGVLMNDTDPENDPLTAVQLAGPAHGTLTLNANGGFSYTPEAGFFGTDTFTYAAFDGTDSSVEATVTLTVAARPTNSVPGTQTLFANSVLRFSATNTPLANALRVGDPDSPTLTVALSVKSGTLQVTNLGALTFVNGLTNGSNVVMSGLVAELNAALEGLAYTPALDSFGEDALVVLTTDEGGRTNRDASEVTLAVQVATLGGLPKVSLGGLNNPGTGLLVTNVVVQDGTLDTNLVQGITFDPVNSVVNVLPVAGQDGSTNSTTLLLRVMFNDGSVRNVVLPVIIYQPLLTSVSGDAVYSGTFGTPLFNPQTSLYEQKVSVMNTTPFNFTALRITATNLPAGVTLRNATLTNGGLPYVEYNLPVPAGGNVTLTLEYYSADRTVQVTPGLRLELLDSVRPITVPNSGSTVEALGRFGYAPDGRVKFYIEFSTQAGGSYFVQYKDAVGDDWKTSPVIINGTGNRVNWMDDGAPNTDSRPGAGRFYRIVTGE